MKNIQLKFPFAQIASPQRVRQSSQPAHGSNPLQGLRAKRFDRLKQSWWFIANLLSVATGKLPYRATAFKPNPLGLSHLSYQGESPTALILGAASLYLFIALSYVILALF